MSDFEGVWESDSSWALWDGEDMGGLTIVAWTSTTATWSQRSGWTREALQRLEQEGTWRHVPNFSWLPTARFICADCDQSFHTHEPHYLCGECR